MKTELLSPAGDLDAAYSAFYFGADAIYLGLRQFSARAEATNFSPEELDEITAYAHSQGKKVYVTINTLIQEAELTQLMETLSVCSRCRVDAIIVQDWGVAHVARTTFPDLALHASTQMAIHNLAGALEMKKMGFSRVVLARELSLSEILEIKEKSGLEVEVFIHGALCYSYSGLCLFSSMTTGRSANRGKCVYSCRDLFKMNGRQYHPFSMKDLALEKDATKLAGLSLKIEGRKKTALYVGATTDYYRRILDTGKVEGTLTDNLKQIFARPWTKLHFNGKNKEVVEPDFVGHRGLPIGQVDKIFNHVISFRPNHPIARYDGIQIDVSGQEKPFGFSAENLTIAGRKVFEVEAGQTLSLTLPPHHPFIKKGDRVYLSSSTRVKGMYHYTKPKPNTYKNRLSLEIDVFIDTEKICACSQEYSSELTGQFNAAKNPEKMQEAVHQAFEKTGDTNFEVGNLKIHNPKSLFVPMSILNELRRLLYAQIRIEEKRPQLPITPHLKVEKGEAKWIIKTDALKLVNSFFNMDEVIYVLHPLDTPEMIPLKSNIRLALPAIMRPERVWIQLISKFVNAGFQKWEVGNPAGLSLLPKKMDITLDNTISMLNSEAIEQALSLGINRVTYSVEDTMENIKALSQKTTKTALVLYQDVPLFISSNCVRENSCASCSKERMETDLINAKGQYRLISEQCQTTVIDTQPLSLPPIAQTIAVGAYRIDFCNRKYTMAEAKHIVDLIREKKKVPHTTTGNFEKQFAN